MEISLYQFPEFEIIYAIKMWKVELKKIKNETSKMCMKYPIQILCTIFKAG